MGPVSVSGMAARRHPSTRGVGKGDDSFNLIWSYTSTN
jgi:hypothetical protein